MRYQMSLEGMNGELEGGDYNGEWKAGKRHGKGVLKWDDGSIYEGLWNADSRMSGTMKMTGIVKLFQILLFIDLYWDI